MKRLLASTAIVVAAATAASAQDDMSRDQLIDSIKNRVSTNIDYSVLSDNELAQIFNIAGGGEMSSQEMTRIKNIVRMANAVEDPTTGARGMPLDEETFRFEVPRSATAERVQMAYDSMGDLDVSVSDLTDSQITRAYLAITSTDSQGGRRKRLRAIAQEG